MSKDEIRREEFSQFLSERHLSAAGMGSRQRGQRSSASPQAAYADGHWKWSDIHAALTEAGQLVTVGPSGMVEMRTVHGTGVPRRATSMSAQILMPGERTRGHRNMKNETRLVHQAPPGAVFIGDGEAFPMERGNVIINPTWTFHESFNPSDSEPAIWIDGFDTGYATLGEVAEEFGLNERYPEDAPYQIIERPIGYSLKTRGLVRAEADERPYPLPPVNYPWTETEAALTALKEREASGDPFEGLYLMLVSPVDGGPTLPTIAWHVQMLRSREKTRAHRHNSTTHYHAFQGEGVTVIEGERLEWTAGDIFVVPPWRWHRHENLMSSDSILFSIDDWPAMTKLGFFKKEEAPA